MEKQLTLRSILLSVCLIPTLATAEMICLEGPSSYTTKKCHYVDPHAEVFRSSARPNNQQNTKQALITKPQTSTNRLAQTKNQPQTRVNHTLTPSKPTRQPQLIANANNRNTNTEQAIIKRAQAMEARFYKQPQISNLSNTEEPTLKRR